MPVPNRASFSSAEGSRNFVVAHVGHVGFASVGTVLESVGASVGFVVLLLLMGVFVVRFGCGSY